MNIYHFNSDVAYISPDIDTINTATETMLKHSSASQLLFDETKYLPSLHTKAKVLHETIIQARQQINDATQDLNARVSAGLKKLNTLRADATEAADEEEREDNAYFRNQAIANLKKYAIPVMKNVQVSFKTLADVTFNPAQTNTYKSGLSTDLVKLTEDVTASAEKIATLENSRQVLNDAMKVLEKGNFTDIAKDTLLTAESISALGLAAPQVEIVKLAIEQMKKTLEHIGEALNYLSMYDQRERLIGQIKVLKTSHAERVADVKHTEAKIRYLDSIHGVYESFFSARAEYAKIEQSITAFANHLEVGNRADYEDRFVSAAPSLLDYLKHVR